MFTIFNQSKKLKDPKVDFYNINVTTLNGKPLELSEFRGKKILVVNVASECGFTDQYKGLEKLYRKFSNKLVVIGVPCNQFGNQEPGNSSEIQHFCELNYGVTFILTEKMKVKGDKQHELYRWLTSKQYNGSKDSSVKWNFQKYLLNEKGQLVNVFYPITKPMNNSIVKHIESK